MAFVKNLIWAWHFVHKLRPSLDYQMEPSKGSYSFVWLSYSRLSWGELVMFSRASRHFHDDIPNLHNGTIWRFYTIISNAQAGCTLLGGYFPQYMETTIDTPKPWYLSDFEMKKPLSSDRSSQLITQTAALENVAVFVAGWAEHGPFAKHSPLIREFHWLVCHRVSNKTLKWDAFFVSSSLLTSSCL